MRSRPRSRSEAGARLARRALALGLPLLLAVAAAGAGEESGFRAGVFDPPRAAPDFALRGSDGSELGLARYRGKVVILAFGFTSCPDVCPTTLSVLARARKELGADGDALQVVYVTVDPERDDPAQMRRYLTSFDPTFVGGTGTAEQLAAVRKEYGIAATRNQVGADYAFNHSSYTYLIDREGRLRALMPYGQPAADYVHDVRLLLKP
jgi:protein SCO1/2